jgi:predicted nucleotidyltransferase
MLTERDIERILTRIVEGCRPLAAGVFGSYAIGRAHAGSDLDLFVIQRSGASSGEQQRAISRLLFGMTHPLDTHVLSPEAFEAEAQDPQSFAWVIARQARVFHWTAEASRLLPSLLEHATFISGVTPAPPRPGGERA